MDKEKFSDLDLVNPNADPNEVQDIGLVGNLIRNPIDDDRKEELQKLMSKEIFPNQPQKDEETSEYEKFLPASFEQNISRDKLIPAPEEWNFFGRPSPDQYALIFQSVYKYGLWHPITVWEQEDGRYMILGGHTRDMVFDELYQMTGDKTYLQIPCKVYKHDQISEVTARRIIILTNIAQRAQENPKLRIKCYCEMTRLEKMEAFYGSGIDVASAVAKLFGVSRATVFLYRKLENLSDDFVDLFEKGIISQHAAGVLSDLPQELQKYIFEKQYFYKISPPILNKLKQSTSVEDIDAAFENTGEEKFKYTFFTNVEKPENFETLPLYVSKDDIQEFKNVLNEIIHQNDKLSNETKEILKKILFDEKV